MRKDEEMVKNYIKYIDYDGTKRVEFIRSNLEPADDGIRYIAPDGTVWTSRKEYLDYVRGD